MNPLDTHAAPDVSDAEEAAYDDRLQQLGQIDGRAIHAEDGDTIDALLDLVRDILPTPPGHDLFNVPPANTPWSELDEHDRLMWSTLATAIRGIAVCYLDEERVRDAAADAA